MWGAGLVPRNYLESSFLPGCKETWKEAGLSGVISSDMYVLGTSTKQVLLSRYITHVYTSISVYLCMCLQLDAASVRMYT